MLYLYYLLCLQMWLSRFLVELLGPGSMWWQWLEWNSYLMSTSSVWFWLSQSRWAAILSSTSLVVLPDTVVCRGVLSWTSRIDRFRHYRDPSRLAKAISNGECAHKTKNFSPTIVTKSKSKKLDYEELQCPMLLPSVSHRFPTVRAPARSTPSTGTASSTPITSLLIGNVSCKLKGNT